MLSPQDHKRIRDLMRRKGQVITIGMVIAVDVMMRVMVSRLVTSRNETKAACYDHY